MDKSSIFLFYLLAAVLPNSLVNACCWDGYAAEVCPFKESSDRYIRYNKVVSLKTETPELCAQACLGVTDFVCRSFDYGHEEGKCYLSDTTSLTGDVVEKHKWSFYERLMSADSLCQFEQKNGLSIDDNDCGSMKGTPEECAKTCLETTSCDCNVFSYQRDTNECLLASQNSRTARSNDKWSIVFDRMDTLTTAHLCNFNASHGMHSMSVPITRLLKSTAWDCAHACLIEESFLCKAFDYNHDTGECHIGNKHNEIAEADGWSFYKRILTSDALCHFKVTNHKFVVSDNTKRLVKETPEKCARACVEAVDFECRTFNYARGDGSCYLSDMEASTMEIKELDGWYLYERVD